MAVSDGLLTVSRFVDEVLVSQLANEESKIDWEFVTHQLLSVIPYLDKDEVGK